jgi:flagellar biosynthesis GTPase FlhF
MKVSNKNVILHNRYVLYLIFIIALVDLLTLVYNYDYYFASIFVLLGFLTSFFSKNMIVILFIAIAFTNILKYGSKSTIEGMSSKDDSDESHEDNTQNNELKEKKTEEEGDTKGKEKKKEKEKEKKKEKKEESSFSVETNEGSNKEKFEQDKNIVYTSEEEKEIEKTEKMILSQEKILKSMNKYKPLLDTLQGITKNMAMVKGAASISDE